VTSNENVEAIVAPAASRGRVGSIASLLALALVVAYPLSRQFLIGAIVPAIQSLGQLATDIFSEAAAWSYALLALVVVLRWGQRPLALLGLGRVGWKTAAFGIGAAIATIALGNIVASLAYGLLGQTPHAAAALAHGSVFYAVVLALRAGAVEELLYRGIAIELLTELTGLRWVAAALSLLLFVLSHAFVFDWLQLLPIAAAGLVMTLLYLWRHDLWANIVAHTLVDAFGLVLLTLGAAS
jgi:membrane protease YdiL (CAAX protease family)